MSTRSVGKVRVLPWGTPGVPGSVPVPYPVHDHCHATLPMEAAPVEPFRPDVINYYCTREPHDGSQVHVCHLLDDNKEPLYLIVWGGE